MILINDNFESVIRSVMWGRNIYDNVKRFLQF
jgi:magnesium-transporting ATPase (P-type)